MSFFLFDNLLTGNMPDAFGLMIFGFVMILISIVLRKLVGEETVAGPDENDMEEVI